ncbi:hypothetical protein [Vibrio brasiliensis]|uniref:Uncharacterized protein n=1 Tax=Vibrio brasiliensis LMG 20546 TaxID=945543 RepID=E8LZ71_9VIBR|nr:hypothetical protein [Vibrio brasiliensis]EGA64057.1 hypothetical protein VIBR0546_06187 [Vibrio brasiliensis LMG 20546]
MKKITYLPLSLFFIASIYGGGLAAATASDFGILTVEKMTQGQLLWLNGRVGEASYTYRRQDEQQCIVKLPVAVGSIGKSDIGISETNGLTIKILSQRLNEALIQGERVNSEDWLFTTNENDKGADGVITSGIRPDEAFILNSKRRWISWFLNDTPNISCR